MKKPFPYPLDRVLERRPFVSGALGAVGAPDPDAAPTGIVSWQHLLNPPDTQVGPRCGGNATENFAEVILRRDAPQAWLHEQILEKLGHLRWRVNGDGLYDLARAKFRPGDDKSGGLYQDEIARIPEISGIFGNHVVRKIPKGWANRKRALKDGPICMPLMITESWGKPSKKTGYITPENSNFVGGHEIMIAAGYSRGAYWYDVPQNSWGAGWGLYGCALLAGEWTDWMQMEEATQWIPEEGWWKRGSILEWIVESQSVASGEARAGETEGRVL